jgi:hypothetical protein
MVQFRQRVEMCLDAGYCFGMGYYVGFSPPESQREAQQFVL